MHSCRINNSFLLNNHTDHHHFPSTTSIDARFQVVFTNFKVAHLTTAHFLNASVFTSHLPYGFASSMAVIYLRQFCALPLPKNTKTHILGEFSSQERTF